MARPESLPRLDQQRVARVVRDVVGLPALRRGDPALDEEAVRLELVRHAVAHVGVREQQDRGLELAPSRGRARDGRGRSAERSAGRRARGRGRRARRRSRGRRCAGRSPGGRRGRGRARAGRRRLRARGAGGAKRADDVHALARAGEEDDRHGRRAYVARSRRRTLANVSRSWPPSRSASCASSRASTWAGPRSTSRTSRPGSRRAATTRRSSRAASRAARTRWRSSRSELGVSVVSVAGAPARGLRRCTTRARSLRVAELIRSERPHILHTHTAKAGAIARAAALLAGDARPPVVAAHLPRPRPQGLLRPGAHRVLPAGRADARARLGRARRGQPGGAGRARGARRRAAREVRGDPARDPARGAARRSDRGRRTTGACTGSRRRVRRRLGRAHDRSEGRRALCSRSCASRASAESTRCSAWSATGPTASGSSSSRTSSGSRGSCYFVGYQADVAGYYRLFDAFLLPSVNEGTPVSAIESLASGTPVVANRVGGVPDVVRDGVDGFLVEPGDIEAAADRLATLAADPALRAKLGEVGPRARSRALLGLAARRRRRPALPLAARAAKGLASASRRSPRGRSRGRARAASRAGSRDRPSASGGRRTRRRARSAPPTASDARPCTCAQPVRPGRISSRRRWCSSYCSTW